MLSPTLFNLYIDRLLVTLKNSGLICLINGTYMGALSYADDITLSCPSVYGLNKMMNICCDFATNNVITFNAQEIICIKYGESVRLTEHVILVPTTPACTWWNRPEEDLSSGKSESTHPSRTVIKSIEVFFYGVK